MSDISQDEIRSFAAFIAAKHGAEAPKVAAQRAQLLIVQGDYQGAAVWRRVEAAVVAVLASPARGRDTSSRA